MQHVHNLSFHVYLLAVAIIIDMAILRLYVDQNSQDVSYDVVVDMNAHINKLANQMNWSNPLHIHTLSSLTS